MGGARRNYVRPAVSSHQQGGESVGKRLHTEVIWSIVKEGAVGCGLTGLAPHDLRSYAESRTMPSRCESKAFSAE
jgi:hypothetical protein